MRRKLIKQDAFDKISNESVTMAERELKEAAPILAKALGKDLSLESFTESSVTYKTPDSTYVHAGYNVKDGKISFTNVEELVIDESSRREKMKSILAETLAAVLKDDHAKAEESFGSYLSMVRWNEFKQNRVPQKKQAANEHNRNRVQKPDIRVAGKDIQEAYGVAQNVLEYVEFMKYGPALAESVAKTDDKGNVTDIQLPTINERNSGRVKRLDYGKYANNLYKSRCEAAQNSENQEFCKAIGHLKRQNAFSDNQALEETLDHIVKTWPNLLYVTQAELAKMVAESLEAVGAANYDDQTCDFMAEGLLRRAHQAYTEKVAQVLHLAGAPKLEEKQDPYIHFQNVVERFYSSLDEKFGLERKAFTDLYEALETVWKKADRQGDEALKQQAAAYGNEVAAVLNSEIKPELEILDETAQWLSSIIEANIEGAGKWVVSNKPHLTIAGDHPDMAKKAKVPGIPGKFEGDWGDEAPAIAQDSMSYKGGKNSKKMRNDSWGQEGGKEVFPSLKNPYVPKPFGDYTMKGEKGVDKDATGQHHSTWQSRDTWPDLQNPYVPKEAGGEGGKGYKAKIDDKDLIVNK